MAEVDVPPVPRVARDRLPFGIRLGFSVGSIGESFYLGLFNTFIAIFYNQAIGLSNSLVGTAVMLALLADAIADPVLGVISDRWRSRWGRRHPFLFAAPVPLAIAVWLIFNPPTIWTGQAAQHQLALFLWLAVWTIVSRLTMALYFVAHLALGGELTRDHDDRSRLFSLNALLGYAMGAGFAFVAWGYFLAGTVPGPNGTPVARYLDAGSYRPLVLAVCVTIVVTIWASAISTMRRIPMLAQPAPDQARLSPLAFYRDMASALRNRNYRMLVIGFFFFMIASGLQETFNVFVNTYFWELSAAQIKWFGLAALPAALVGAIVAPPLMRRFDRKPVLVWSIGVMAVAAQLPVDLRLIGLFPANGSPALLPSVLAGAATLALTVSIAAVTILSMLGDIIDANELDTGMRQEGLFYSARVLFGKAAGSVGHFIAGLMLDWVVHMPFHATAGVLPPSVVARLGIVSGPVMGLCGFISLIFYARYDMTRARHRAVLDALDFRDTVRPSEPL